MSSNRISIFSSMLALLLAVGCSSSGSNGARLPASNSDNGIDSGLTAKVIDAGPHAPGPSCDGLPATCGSTGDGSCCESPVVPGGKFFRSYDGIVFEDQSYPATVSDFRLDAYEVSVGRFRRFVAAYAPDMVPAGAGKNPNDADDTGWDPAWNALLPSDPAALMISLACKPDTETWTDAPGANENRPLNCFTWYAAFAFCIWDGGRLPTEAEWNYAAAGGSEQREYPWGNDRPDCSYATWYDGPGPSYCQSTFTNDVGSEAPKGNGKWGQADLAGNLWEWNLDYSTDSYANHSCTNCADHVPAQHRVIRGGAYDNDGTGLRASRRDWGVPEGGDSAAFSIGARCARAPQ